MNRDDLALYVIGEFDGDSAALERELAGDEAARGALADEARFDLLLRDVAAAATFCPACRDLVRDARCDTCGAAVRPGGYRVERVLVANAHGRMYVARDGDGKQVALKELAFVHAPTLDAIAAFEREAKLVRALEHPAIPRFVASFEEGAGVHARYYLAQELVAGDALDVRFADHFYTEAEIVDIARQVLDILVYLQSLSPMVIHRDVKPANLIRRADGTIALVDFGAAYVQGTTAGATTIGTFGYMPVEQLAGIVDATTDPFALGASLVHLLARQEPWKILHEPDLALNVSRPLRAWLDRLVARDPKQRFANAAAARAALDARAAIAPPRRRGRGWLVAGGVGAVVLAGSAVGVAVLPRPSEQVEPATIAPPPKTLLVMPVDQNAPLPPGHQLDVDFKGVPLVAVLEMIAQACDYNLVVPDEIGGTVTASLDKVGCDQAVPPLLEAHGLVYLYEHDANILRITTRKDLADERELPSAAALGDPLPGAGDTVTIAGGRKGLHVVLRELATAGHVNLVVPDTIGGEVDVRFVRAPWTRALDAVLAANGLGYRYHAAGRVLTIAPRKDLAAMLQLVPSAQGGGVVLDSLDRQMISDGVAKVMERVKACTKVAPDARGIVKTHVVVAPDGRVSEVKITQTPDAKLGDCVADELRKATFPATKRGGSFSYPFVF